MTNPVYLLVDVPEQFIDHINGIVVNILGLPIRSRILDGSEPVAKIVQNDTFQLSLQTLDGEPFDMSKYIGASFFLAPQPAAECESRLELTKHMIETQDNYGSAVFELLQVKAECDKLRQQLAELQKENEKLKSSRVGAKYS